MHGCRPILHHVRQLRRFPQELVGVQILEDELHRCVGHRLVRLVAERRVLHGCHAVRFFGRLIPQVVRLHAVHVLAAVATRHAVDVDAHEELALLRAHARPVPQADEGIGGPRHHDVDAAPLQLVAHLQADGEIDVLLLDATR